MLTSRHQEARYRVRHHQCVALVIRRNPRNYDATAADEAPKYGASTFIRQVGPAPPAKLRLHDRGERVEEVVDVPPRRLGQLDELGRLQVSIASLERRNTLVVGDA